MTLIRASHRATQRSAWPALGLFLMLGCGERPELQQVAAGAARGAPAASESGVDDRLILAGAKVALPPPGTRREDLPQPQSEGAGLVTAFCAACHDPPTPTIHSATDWPGVIRRMWLRMDRLPPEFSVAVPTPAQRQITLNYLVNHALKVGTATLPVGQGRAAFVQVCGRCHALPDPRQHTPVDWPIVVIRMEQRMEQMQVDRPPPATTLEIAQYLNRVSTTMARK